MKKIILIFISVISILSCNVSKNNDNEQIKKTVIQYFNSIKENDSLQYRKLIYFSDKFPGGTSSDLFFLHKNFSKINPNNILLKNIKVKDTFNLVKKKYVMFTFKKNNSKPFEYNQDLKMYLLFWNEVGYDKIYEIYIIGNMPEWEDQEPIYLK